MQIAKRNVQFIWWFPKWQGIYIYKWPEAKCFEVLEFSICFVYLEIRVWKKGSLN